MCVRLTSTETDAKQTRSLKLKSVAIEDLIMR